MLEIPEAVVIANQLNQTVKGKRINRAVAAASPHKFAWYFGDPAGYNALLQGRTVENVKAYSGRVEIGLSGNALLHFGDGAILRFYKAGEKLPEKHQLLVTFGDGSSLLATVAMYGGLWAFTAGDMDDNFYKPTNEGTRESLLSHDRKVYTGFTLYYKAAKMAVPPLSDRFDYKYFLTLFDEKGLKMSAKAFLATEQRIPGLGNGVLQDILLNAKIHPKKKISALTESERRGMFDSIKSTLLEMVNGGGRDTERDLFGNPGGYKTKLGKNNGLMLCPNCGGAVKKEAYMGGSIYYCAECQKN